MVKERRIADKSPIKTYFLVRDEDVSGVSGVGVVADVAQFENGKVCVAFRLGTAGVSNLIFYDTLEDVETVHGHEGRTYLVRA